MLAYLVAILGLGALCAAWVLFQLWLLRVDPEKAANQTRCGGCGSCGCGTRGDEDMNRPA